ncbi:hypothetical protein [Candidatus Mycolicibacterium alkanivorans]|uniref:hypothetical protein n=1 Tax=Candidatus Mycolicibacterium alkanivorans TaxID=2954114 RepID=UPI00355800AB
MSRSRTVTAEANPYVWPQDGDIPGDRTALINIGWQVDFCGKGGDVDAMGYDLSRPRQVVHHHVREVVDLRQSVVVRLGRGRHLEVPAVSFVRRGQTRLRVGGYRFLRHGRDPATITALP